MKLFSGCLWWGYEGSLKMLYRGLGAADWVCQSLNGMDEFQAALLGIQRQPENTAPALSGCLKRKSLCRLSPNPPSLHPTPLLPTSACAVPPTLPTTHATWHKYRQQPRHSKTIRIDF
nr:hypothetical protein [uncultured Kingella sp.]